MVVMEENDAFLQAEWPIRNEGPEEIAARLLPTVAELSEIDPLLGDWCTEKQKDVFASVAELAEWVRGQESRGGIPGKGYWPIVFSNGPRDEGVSLGVTAGVTNTSPVLRNEVSLKAKPTQEQVAFLTEHAEALLSVIVWRWEPDWAAVASLEMYAVQPWMTQRSPVVGGLTWLPDHRGVVPELPAGARVSRLAGGTLIDLREEDGSLPTLHGIDRVARVAEVLYEGGLLSDMPISVPDVREAERG